MNIHQILEYLPHRYPFLLIDRVISCEPGKCVDALKNVKADKDSMYYFVGIDNARFKKPVTAGDTLVLHVDLERHMRGMWKFKAHARVESVTVAEADLLCAVRSLSDTSGK